MNNLGNIKERKLITLWNGFADTEDIIYVSPAFSEREMHIKMPSVKVELSIPSPEGVEIL